MDFSDYRLTRPTTVTTVGNKVTTTVTTVASMDERYRRTDALYQELSDLVNEQFRYWYYKVFHALGPDKVYQLAAKARQEAKTDQRHYFSRLLQKNVNAQ